MSEFGTVHAPFGYIHCRDIQNLAVLKWLAENAKDHPESVTNIVGRSREYPTFVHMPQKVQSFVRQKRTNSMVENETEDEDVSENVSKKRTDKKCVVKINKNKISSKISSPNNKTAKKNSIGLSSGKSDVVWTNLHSSIGAEVAMYFNINNKMKLFNGTVIKYGLPSKEGMMDHLYGILFEEDGDECDWDQSEFEKGLEDYITFTKN
jgi:hypothetical protein